MERNRVVLNFLRSVFIMQSRLGCLKTGPKVGFGVCRKADALGGAHQCSAGPPDGTERCRNLPQVLNQLRCHHHHLHHERGLDGLLCTVWTADIRARRGYPVKFTYYSTVVLRYLTVWVYRYLHGIVCCTAVPTITGSEHGIIYLFRVWTGYYSIQPWLSLGTYTADLSRIA